uniref:C2H2-type domain-containing protein n=1 Tax=Iconisemion striatum TaxID=60296 RepID=A0A1A7WY95_9TELE
MDDIETPYEEEEDFIECRVCEKSLRGETLYKIHVTTAGHLKKEDTLVAEGKATKQRHVPKFDNIVEYLKYLKLNEPIIGLNYLEEVIGFDPQFGPKYFCRLCNQSAVLGEMVCHVIGRKHRQKYVEFRRPDLVSSSIKSQAGKSIRAKAEIIERQDGRGNPKLLHRKARGVEGRLNITRVPPSERQYRKQHTPQNSARDLPPLLPELKDYHRRNTSGHERYPDEARMRRQFEAEDNFSRGHFEEDRDRSDYREDFDYDPKPDYDDLYEKIQAPRNSRTLELFDVPRYDYDEQTQQSQDHAASYYPTEAPLYKRPHPEKDVLEEFYSQEVRRGQVRAHELQPSSKMMPPDCDAPLWSMEMESGRHDRRRGSSEPEVKRRNLDPLLKHDQSYSNMFNIVRDYHHKTGSSYAEETFDHPGTSGTRPPSGQTIRDHGTIADIPEPFRRFLKGGEGDEGRNKRRSRFSDASPDELNKANEMIREDLHHHNDGDRRSSGGPMTSQIYYSDPYQKLQNPPFSEGYKSGGSRSGNVFDVLKNVEITNAEEAIFLKSKLSSVLEEFKSIKEKKTFDNQYQAGSSMTYGDLMLDQLPPRAHEYERLPRDDPDPRQPESPGFSHRGRWDQHDPIERHQEYDHHPHREPSLSGRGHYEGYEDGSPFYSERPQEPMNSHDYQTPDMFFDPHSAASPSLMEQSSRMQRDPRYSNNLDKITCALLELVARK